MAKSLPIPRGLTLPKLWNMYLQKCAREDQLKNELEIIRIFTTQQDVELTCKVLHDLYGFSDKPDPKDPENPEKGHRQTRWLTAFKALRKQIMEAALRENLEAYVNHDTAMKDDLPVTCETMDRMLAEAMGYEVPEFWERYATENLAKVWTVDVPREEEVKRR